MSRVLRRVLTNSFRCRKTCFSFSLLEDHYPPLLKYTVFATNSRLKYTYKPRALREGPHPSRYHPGSVAELAEEHIKCVLHGKEYMDDEEWDNFKVDVTTDLETITEENFSSVVMSCLLSDNKLCLAHSFINYLENSNMRPNFLTYLKYISLCSTCSEQIDKDLILKTLNKVKFLVDNSPVLDMKTAEYTIQGLCATDKWRDSFEYLKKINDKPNIAIRCALACAAIRNGDEALSWDILTKWFKDGEVPNDRVIAEFMSIALKRQKVNPCKADTFVQEIFQYMQMKSLIVSVDVIKIIEQYFRCHRRKWDISHTKVSRMGNCETCGHSLKLQDLTNEEFNYLKEAFLDRVVKKSDVFINTTAREFDSYINFIERFKPFHVVIDGLNAAYTFRYGKSPKNLAAQLLKITKMLAGKSRNLLVMGRNHMQRWPSYAMQKISHRARLFYTDNISQDDPFTIYAALASGPHTLFVSSDLMRDHISRLEDPKTIQLFKQWQLSRQIFITADEDNRIKFTEPLRHSINIQGNMENGWHIPYDDKIILDPYEELNNWLCLKKVL